MCAGDGRRCLISIVIDSRRWGRLKTFGCMWDNVVIQSHVVTGNRVINLGSKAFDARLACNVLQYRLNFIFRKNVKQR